MSDDRTPAPGAPEPAAVPGPATPVEPVVAEPVTNSATARSAGRRSGAIGWGIVLVLVGGALLVSQFVPGVELWRYWPLIIIAFGVRAMFGTAHTAWSIRQLGEGLTTVAIGLVFLGQMLGYLGWNVWLNILRLWPLLLVSLGLEIIGKGLKSNAVRFLGSVVIIGGLAYGALVMTPTGSWITVGMPVGDSTSFSLSADHESHVDEGSARVEGGVGTLTVAAGSDLATAEGLSPFEPVFDVETADGTADVSAGLGSHSWGPFEGEAKIGVTLDDAVVWDLTVSAGVTEYDVDLRDLTLSRLTLDAGVSDGVLTLGRSDAGSASDRVEAAISSGVSSLKVRVPRGDNARVTVKGGLVGLDTSDDWTLSRTEGNRVYESDGFDDDGAYWDIEIEAGIGSITIEYY